jgi:hypothetical protein
MTAGVQVTASPEPFLHLESGAVRFWVLTDSGAYTGATISKETLHYRFKADRSGADAVASYEAHRTEIDDAVRRRIANGSIEPVMLRESDLPAPPRA